MRATLADATPHLRRLLARFTFADMRRRASAGAAEAKESRGEAACRHVDAEGDV